MTVEDITTCFIKFFSGYVKRKVFVLLSLIFIVSGVSDVVIENVSVKEGDSVTLQTGVKTNQQGRVKWYFDDTRIAQIYGDLSTACTDVQCNEGTERFRDRLKLDHQTGSLTIMNIRTTDSGEYKLQINNSIKSFIVTVIGSSGVQKVSASMSVMEGDSVTFNTDSLITKYQQDRFRWYFNDTRIVQIVGDERKICTDDQCKERFRDRLKLDHQTGSLTITDTRNTDSGDYQLKIVHSIVLRHSISIISIKRFSITVNDSSLPLGLIAGMCAVVGVVLVAAAAAVIYYRKSEKRKERKERVT